MTPALLATSSAITAADPSIGSSLLRMVFGLVVVAGSILAVTKVLQYVRGKPMRNRVVSPLEVISRQSLGKGLQLAVVRFAGKEVLVGIAGQNITFYDSSPAAVAIPGLDETLRSPLSEELTSRPNIDSLAAMFGNVDSAPPRPSVSRYLPEAPPRSALERLRDATARR